MHTPLNFTFCFIDDIWCNYVIHTANFLISYVAGLPVFGELPEISALTLPQ